MALPPAVWHRVQNATDLWDCSACGFTATSMQQATHNSWHNQLATAIQKAEGDAMVVKNELSVTKNELAKAQSEIQMLTQKHYAVVAELNTLTAKGIKVPETEAPKKIMKRKRQLCFECGLPGNAKDKLEKSTISTKGKPDREEYAHYECWKSWSLKMSRREQGPDSGGGVGLFQQMDHTFGKGNLMNVADEAMERNAIAVHVDPGMPPGQMLVGSFSDMVRVNVDTYSSENAIGIESPRKPELKESDYNGITQEQEADAIARLFGESK